MSCWSSHSLLLWGGETTVSITYGLPSSFIKNMKTNCNIVGTRPLTSLVLSKTAWERKVEKPSALITFSMLSKVPEILWFFLEWDWAKTKWILSSLNLRRYMKISVWRLFIHDVWSRRLKNVNTSDSSVHNKAKVAHRYHKWHFLRIMYEKSFINLTTWNLKFIWPLIKTTNREGAILPFFISGIPLSTKTCYVLTSRNNDVDAAEETRK